MRRGFIQWCEELLKHMGFSDAELGVISRVTTQNYGKAVHSEVERGGHGLVLIARNPSQPWRERLLNQESGKVVALLGSNHCYSEVLVPFDLSGNTLMVLMLLEQIYRGKSGFHFQFIHVLQGPEETAKRRWQKLLGVIGISEPLNMKMIPPTGDVADDLLRIIEEGNYGTIIMGKRGLSGIKRRMLGSISARILNGLTDQSIFLVD
jgi:2,4-dienoyl-CoA reductase (NADPH2)